MLSSMGDTRTPWRAKSWWSNLKLCPIFRIAGSSSTPRRAASASSVGICFGVSGASKDSSPLAAALGAWWARGM